MTDVTPDLDLRLHKLWFDLVFKHPSTLLNKLVDAGTQLSRIRFNDLVLLFDLMVIGGKAIVLLLGAPRSLDMPSRKLSWTMIQTCTWPQYCNRDRGEAIPE